MWRRGRISSSDLDLDEESGGRRMVEERRKRAMKERWVVIRWMWMRTGGGEAPACTHILKHTSDQINYLNLQNFYCACLSLRCTATVMENRVPAYLYDVSLEDLL